MSEWPAVSHRYLQCFMCFVRTHYMLVGVCIWAVALQLDGFNEAGCPHNEYTGVAEGSSYWKPLEFIRCELVSSPVLIRRNLLYTHTHTHTHFTTKKLFSLVLNMLLFLVIFMSCNGYLFHNKYIISLLTYARSFPFRRLPIKWYGDVMFNLWKISLMYFKAIKDPQYLSIMSHKFLKRIIISFNLCFVALNPIC